MFIKSLQKVFKVRTDPGNNNSLLTDSLSDPTFENDIVKIAKIVQYQNETS